MPYYITPAFNALIGKERLEILNQHPSTVYGLDAQLNIAYLNPAWFAFAQENGNQRFLEHEWVLGKNIFDAIPDALVSFYKNLFISNLDGNRSAFAPKQLDYECSSPELYRRFSMHLYPLAEEGILVVHSLVVEESHQQRHSKEVIFKPHNYIDKHGILLQCANCRRIHNLTYPERWDWVPKLIEKPYAKTSHGICSLCAEHYYLG